MTKEKQIERTIEWLNNAINVERNSYFGKGCITVTLIEADKILDVLQGYRKQEWISVEDRLPEESTNVLAYSTKYNEIIFLYYCGEDEWEDEKGFASAKYYGITHWMPLPEPPKMKGE